MATLHLRALLYSTHLDADGHQRTFHAPLAGNRVIATGSAGERVSATVDGKGRATIRLPTGRYVLTLSQRDACFPLHVSIESGSAGTAEANLHVTVQSGTVRTIDLLCVAP